MSKVRDCQDICSVQSRICFGMSMWPRAAAQNIFRLVVVHYKREVRTAFNLALEVGAFLCPKDMHAA